MTQHTFGANKQFHGHFLETGRFDSRILLKSVWDESEADLAAFFFALGAVWPIDSAHQRWCEASIKKYRFWVGEGARADREGAD